GARLPFRWHVWRCPFPVQAAFLRQALGDRGKRFVPATTQHQATKQQRRLRIVLFPVHAIGLQAQVDHFATTVSQGCLSRVLTDPMPFFDVQIQPPLPQLLPGRCISYEDNSAVCRATARTKAGLLPPWIPSTANSGYRSEPSRPRALPVCSAG